MVRLLMASVVLSAAILPAYAQNPVPIINQPLVPDAKAPGGGQFVLTINGTGFASGSAVFWNGNLRPSIRVNSSQMKAVIWASDIAKPGTASVKVLNPGPGGGMSNTALFDVTVNAALMAVGTHSDFATDRQPNSSPRALATGDFNGDGKLDIAVANEQFSVAILLGNGDGTFGPPTVYGPGSDLNTSIAAGDFNRDGKLDLVVTSYTAASILLGNGDGTFRAGPTYTTGSHLASVAVGDLNADGKLDLALADSNSSNVSILLGNGDGTFQTPVSYQAGPGGTTSVALGDFNADGKLDLAVTDGDGNAVSILLGNGDGTFRSAVNYATGTDPQSVAAGDFNADGKLDLAVANSSTTSPDISILLGNGDGTFRNAVSYAGPGGSTSVAIGDFNADNIPDLAVAAFPVSQVGIFLGNGDGSFRPSVNYGTGSYPLSMTIGDFNRDGKLDMIVAGYGAGVVSVSLQNSSSFATQLVATSSAPQPVTLSNTTGLTVNISSIVISGGDGGDFSQTNNCGSSLPAGGYCSVDVTFTPSQSGLRTASVTTTYGGLGSPLVVNLTGVGTVVKLSPDSLSFGKVQVGHGSAPRPTTLTNTGSTTLQIASITITGANNNDFSQTNDCPKSLGAGSFCTITVYFTPSQRGSRYADVSVADDGGGSPQQVQLSGTGCVMFHGKCNTAGDLRAPAIRSALAQKTVVAVPGITGPNRVGTRILDLVDSSRDDPFLSDGGKRELLVRLWYPASLTQDCKPAEYTSPEVWSYFSQLVGLPLPQVTTHSCADAPVTVGTHPVVVFTPGYTGTSTDYTFLFEDLASRGYVVASVNHTYEATAVEFPDGRFVKSVVGSHLAADLLPTDNETMDKVVSARLNDLKFVFDELGRLNSRAGSPFAGSLDTKHIAVAGHSLGGLTALLAVEEEPRFSAGIVIDGDIPDRLVKATKTPVLILTMGRERWSNEECELWDNLTGPRLAVNLPGAEHLTPTDAAWLTNGAIKTGTIGLDQTVAALRSYIADFLDNTLPGAPKPPALTGTSSAYPAAVVVQQQQALCSTR
jgi:dienelactone hydrolase